jgi:hypothetical protein
MKHWILAFLISLAPLEADARLLFQGGGVSYPVSQTVTTNLASTSSTIPNGFVGISIRFATAYSVPNYTKPVLDVYTETNTSLISLLQLLGTDVQFRLGGTAGDDGNNFPNPTQANVNHVAAFVNAISAQPMLFQLPLHINQPTNSVALLGMQLAATPSVSTIVEFGNEPDAYGVSVATYHSLWNTLYSDVIASYPSSILDAPDVSNLANMATYTTGLTPGKAGLHWVTSHYYEANNLTVAGIGAMLATVGSQNYTSNVAYSSNFKMNETNIATGQTNVGVVDGLTGTAWFLEEAIQLAKAGAQGLNVWNGDVHSTGVTPIPENTYLRNNDGTYSPHSAFWGMLLFSKITGQTIAATTITGSGSANAISTVGASGNANQIIVNGSPVNTLSIKPAQSTAWSTATVLRVASSDGTGCLNTTPTVGGAQIGASGTWAGTPFTINNGDSFSLGPCEAALVQIQP